MSIVLDAALLSMGAYDAFWSGSLAGDFTNIGRWTYSGHQMTSGNHNFFGITYQSGNEYVLAYCGTNDKFGWAGVDGDIYNGWGVGRGSWKGAQAHDAQQLYSWLKSALPENSSLLLTGHSLGGGLAGLMADIHHERAIIFDNMPFELAANNVHKAATAPHESRDYDSEAEYFYDWGEKPAPDSSYIESYAATGDPLDYLRQYSSVPTEYLYAGGNLHSLEYHSYSLLVTLIYASEKGYTDWQSIADSFLPALFNEKLAVSTVPKYFMTKNADAGDALREMIAYSAIDSGDPAKPDQLPYGNVAIASMLDDATDLAHVLHPASKAAPSQPADSYSHPTALAEIAVQYAGHLASLRSTETTLTSGVFKTQGSGLVVDLSSSTWGNSEATEIQGFKDLVGELLAQTGGVGIGYGYPFADGSEFLNKAFKSAVSAAVGDITSVVLAGRSTSMGGLQSMDPILLLWRTVPLVER